LGPAPCDPTDSHCLNARFLHLRERVLTRYGPPWRLRDVAHLVGLTPNTVRAEIFGLEVRWRALANRRQGKAFRVPHEVVREYVLQVKGVFDRRVDSDHHHCPERRQSAQTAQSDNDPLV